jgi:dTDP-4-dehydrorhamnose reductase
LLILLAGASGQLGQELLPRLRTLGEVVCVDRADPGKRGDITTVDLGDLSAAELLLNRTRPDLVVNAAAYTAVDRAETESATAYRVNAELPGCLARWAMRNQRLLVHYSTDYVFPGQSDHPFVENDPTGPLNVYGKSKLAGEEAVAASGCRNLVLRTSWVYSAHGNNFVLTMLKLAEQRDVLNIVSDQEGCPTWARNLAAATGQALAQIRKDPSKAGLYHYCDAGIVSWLDFARLIFETAVELGLLSRVPVCNEVDSSAFRQAAIRPAYSAMDTTRIRQTLGITPEALPSSLKACLQDLVDDE